MSAQTKVGRFVVVALLLPTMVAATLGRGHAVAQQPGLSNTLAIMARVAALYRDSALGFTCAERISETRYRSQNRVGRRATHRFDYFYVFNSDEAVAASAGELDAGLQDYRTSRGGDPYAEPVRVDPASVGLAAHMARVYSWIFLFQPGMDDYYAFSDEGEGRALGRDALVVGFEPKLPYQPGVNDWFGRAWIDRETFQLLQVEAASSNDYMVAAAAGPVLQDSRLLFTWAKVEFDQEKNGMRFASRVSLVGTMLGLPEAGEYGYRRVVRGLRDRGVRLNRLFRVQQVYDNYRFFSVRTATEVNELIRGGRVQQ